MISFKSLFIKLLVFCLAYALLLGAFSIPAFRNASGNFFSSSSEAFLNVFLPKGYIHLERNKTAEAEKLNVARVMFGSQKRVDEQMAEASKRGDKNVNLDLTEFQIKVEEFLLMPLIFFLSLLAITPVGWRRKLIGAVWGILLLLLFVWLKMLFYTLYYYGQHPSGVYEGKGLLLHFATFVFNYAKMGVNVLAATLVWALVAFRFSDWRKTLGGLAG